MVSLPHVQAQVPFFQLYTQVLRSPRAASLSRGKVLRRYRSFLTLSVSLNGSPVDALPAPLCPPHSTPRPGWRAHTWQTQRPGGSRLLTHRPVPSSECGFLVEAPFSPWRSRPRLLACPLVPLALAVRHRVDWPALWRLHLLPPASLSRFRL